MASASVQERVQAWQEFYTHVQRQVDQAEPGGAAECSGLRELCRLGLAQLAADHVLSVVVRSVEGAPMQRFWRALEAIEDDTPPAAAQAALCNALTDLCEHMGRCDALLSSATTDALGHQQQQQQQQQTPQHQATSASVAAPGHHHQHRHQQQPHQQTPQHQAAAAGAPNAAGCPQGQGHPLLPPSDRAALLTLRSRLVQRVGACVLSTGTGRLQRLLARFFGHRLEEYGRAAAAARRRRRQRFAGDDEGADSSEEDGDDDGDEGDEDEEDSAEDEDAMDTGDEAPARSAVAPPHLDASSAQALSTVSACMRALGLQDINEQAYAGAISAHLGDHLSRRTQRAFGRSVMRQAHRYASQLADSFLRPVLPSGVAGEAALASWQRQLHYYVYYTVGCLRIAEMFDILLDYPDSMPAVQDVADCLRHTNLAGRFVSSLTASTRARLLRAGAATSDIIVQYVSTIKALRRIDPSGLLLQAVGEPIREYLRSRKDTIRCIMTMLTEDGGGGGGDGGGATSLFEELGRAPQDGGAGTGPGGGRGGPEEGGDYESEEALLASFDAWQPDPVDSAAAPARMRSAEQRRRLGDVVGMLVGIYGSKELLINEWRSMLADRLLSKASDHYDADREIRTLELLKLRFGEANMHSSEIMLKDIADSKRLNTTVHQLPASPPPEPDLGEQQEQGVPTQGGGAPHPPRHLPVCDVSATIVSHLFWPAMPADEVQLPEEVERALESYSSRYHQAKKPRKLVWRRSQGAVRLSITVGGRKLPPMAVNPVAAAVLLAFRDRAEWQAAELAEHLRLPAPELRRRALFWVNQGVLLKRRESAVDSSGGGGAGVVYCRAESLDQEAGEAAGARGLAAQRGGSGTGGLSALSDEEEDAGVGGQGGAGGGPGDALQAEMGAYEPFILGMLANFDALPLDRIHNMLKMFASDPPYDKGQEQLAAFLAHLAAEEKLAVEGGVYRKKA